jgi:hypothetical protein
MSGRKIRKWKRFRLMMITNRLLGNRYAFTDYTQGCACMWCKRYLQLGVK